MNTDKIYAEAIANEYAPKDTSKVVALKKLDKKAKLPANIFAFSFGTIMALVLGTGMCLSMNVIGSGSTAMTVVGIIVGIIGIIGVSVNYPIYRKMIEKGKKKYAFEIMTLAKEISEAGE
ncbi:MAG: dihydropteridine reductase [Acutalibacteraceae bacterium]